MTARQLKWLQDSCNDCKTVTMTSRQLQWLQDSYNDCKTVKMTARQFKWLQDSYSDCKTVSMTARQLQWLQDSFNDCKTVKITARQLQWLQDSYNDCKTVKMTARQLQWLQDSYNDCKTTDYKTTNSGGVYSKSCAKWWRSRYDISWSSLFIVVHVCSKQHVQICMGKMESLVILLWGLLTPTCNVLVFFTKNRGWCILLEGCVYCMNYA